MEAPGRDARGADAVCAELVSDFSGSLPIMLKKMMITMPIMLALVLAGCGGSPSDRAEKIQEALDGNFSCDWEQENEDQPLYRCDGEGLILFTGDDDEVAKFVDGMKDSGIGGSVVVGGGYAIVTETKSPAKEVKETLGDDDAEIVEIGKDGGSGYDDGYDSGGGFSWW